MKQLTSFISGFFSEDAPQSSMRAIVIFTFSFVFWAWAYVSIKKMELQVIPESVLFVLASLLGAKLYQKKQEIISGQTTNGGTQVKI